MKSTLFAAALCINVGVVVDEFVFVGLHSLEDFLPLYHAHFTVHCLCRLHAIESLTLIFSCNPTHQIPPISHCLVLKK
jgi:hypothetical protein